MKLTAASLCITLLASFWIPTASAYSGYEDGCAGCHSDLTDRGPDHDTHADLANNNCSFCHDGGSGRDNPPLSNCTGCHGREADGNPSADLWAGLGRGLRQHHGVALCGGCHQDSDHDVTGSAPESVFPSFYSQALGGTGLDPCDGSEENFPSRSVSLDNDGDGLTDGADSDCGPQNTPPVADAGADQTVNVGDTVTLDGSNSSDADSDSLTYSWSLETPAGSGATLSGSSTVSPTFVPDIEGSYTATLVVNDGTVDSTPDSAVITAQLIVVNNPPVSNAGPDQTVDIGSLVTLDGSGSSDADGDPLTYSWSLDAPAGSGATLSGATNVDPEFVPDVEGVYTAVLIVNDGMDDSAPDSVSITAQAVAGNTPPVADAGPNQSALLGDTVLLDGSGSSDVDGDSLTYTWSLSSPAGSAATLSDPTIVNPTFVPDVAGDYVAQLIVNDGTQDSVPDSAVVAAQAEPVNSPPVANAGLDRNVTVGDTVVLDGSDSTDADGDPLTFSWSLTTPAGSDATLSDSTAVSPSFEADVVGEYVAQLIVNDGADDSAADSVRISASATPVNTPPVANAGLDQSILVGATVTLDGSRSSDSDGDLLSYSWSLTSVPAGSAAALSDSTVVSPTFVADLAGDYVAQLIVDDGTDVSAPDSVTIMAAPPAVNQPPVADAGSNQVVRQGATVTLNGSGSSDPDGDALGFNWSLTSIPAGSDAVLSDPNIIGPDFVADLVGNYVAQLIVNDGEFNSVPDTVMIIVTLDAALPQADSGGPYSGFVDEPITLDGSGSFDSDGGQILSWEWDFGDGETATGESVTHTYSEAGVYDVRLTVTDDEGQTDSTMTTVTVETRDTSNGGGGAIDLVFLWLLGLGGFLVRCGSGARRENRVEDRHR
jgi:chitodextrinase